MKGSEFVCDSIDLLYYKLYKISLSRGGLYIDSPEWPKSKKARINPKNSDHKCLQYAITVALNHKNIKSHAERISNIKTFIDQYNWKKIHFPSHKNDWNEFEKNNKTIALNVLFVPYNTEQIRPVHVSKYNSNRENQIILLEVTDNKKWHYLAVTSLSALLRGVTSTDNGEFYCLSCFHSFRTKNKLKNMKMYAKIMTIIRKNIFACLFSVRNTISLSRHEQVCLMRLRFERYFSHHRAMWRSISRNVASLNILVHDVINLLYHDYCYVEMPNKNNNILKYNHGEYFMKAPFIIYADMESLLEKISTSHNNPNESSTTKINKYTLGFHYLQIVRLILQKISLIIIEVKIV